MKPERTRDNGFQLTGTAQELSALVGAARMSLEGMEQDERGPPSSSTSSAGSRASTTQR